MAPKKVNAKVESAVVPETVVVETVSETVAAPETVDAVAPDTLAQIVEKISQVTALMKDLSPLCKLLAKQQAKLASAKVGKKQKKTAAAGRAPSGFAKPAMLTDELCAFLSLPKETMLARTAVTKLLNAYIVENKLQKPENKKFIIPDAKLAKLLQVDDTIILTYFNLQRHMKHLFVPSTPVVASA